MSTEKYNKEQIRNRMLKYAAAFWGIKKAENFDPVVKLLLEALSNEIYMLGEDFTAIETRLLEKTARILTPDILTSPFPAHGIVHAYPIEPCYLITRASGMYYESDSLTRKLSTGSVSFYPACDTLLHKADVKYMVCDDLLYRIAPTLEKTMIARAETRMPPRTVWLGMAVDESISDLEDFSFYLDFPNLTESYEYLLLLPCTEWSVEGKTVVMEGGIHEKTTIQKEPTRAFFQDYDVMSVIDKEVMDIYSKHFLNFRVIPLRTGSYESLLSVHSVKDSDGKNYHELLYPAKDSTESYGTYSIRKGGCERFDSRSARELLGYLSDLLDDETHAFNAVSSIKLQALTIQMEQLMAQMKQTADNMNEFRETPYYLMIDELSGKILGTKLDEPSQEKQIKDNLRTKLSACSPDTFNYRIFIEYNKA